jgi:hypothetical protein
MSKTKPCPANKFFKMPKVKPLTKIELEKINLMIKDGRLNGLIDGEEQTQILFNLIHTRRYE